MALKKYFLTMEEDDYDLLTNMARSEMRSKKATLLRALRSYAEG